jgi:hypothetical protein
MGIVLLKRLVKAAELRAVGKGRRPRELPVTSAW